MIDTIRNIHRYNTQWLYILSTLHVLCILKRIKYVQAFVNRLSKLFIIEWFMSSLFSFNTQHRNILFWHQISFRFQSLFYSLPCVSKKSRMKYYAFAFVNLFKLWMVFRLHYFFSFFKTYYIVVHFLFNMWYLVGSTTRSVKEEFKSQLDYFRNTRSDVFN